MTREEVAGVIARRHTKTAPREDADAVAAEIRRLEGLAADADECFEQEREDEYDLQMLSAELRAVAKRLAALLRATPEPPR